MKRVFFGLLAFSMLSSPVLAQTSDQPQTQQDQQQKGGHHHKHHKNQDGSSGGQGTGATQSH